LGLPYTHFCYNNFEKRIADILRNLPAGDNIFYSDIYDLFLHNTPSGPKKLIISILGSAATKESAELLYKLIDDGLLIEVGEALYFVALASFFP
jgi:hypothetical protein